MVETQNETKALEEELRACREFVVRMKLGILLPKLNATTPKLLGGFRLAADDHAKFDFLVGLFPDLSEKILTQKILQTNGLPLSTDWSTSQEKGPPASSRSNSAPAKPKARVNRETYQGICARAIAGKCSLGEDCMFSHETHLHYCRNFVLWADSKEGGCKQGDYCRFSHDHLTPRQKKAFVQREGSFIMKMNKKNLFDLREDHHWCVKRVCRAHHLPPPEKKRQTESRQEASRPQEERQTGFAERPPLLGEGEGIGGFVDRRPPWRSEQVGEINLQFRGTR